MCAKAAARSSTEWNNIYKRVESECGFCTLFCKERERCCYKNTNLPRDSRNQARLHGVYLTEVMPAFKNQRMVWRTYFGQKTETKTRHEAWKSYSPLIGTCHHSRRSLLGCLLCTAEPPACGPGLEGAGQADFCEGTAYRLFSIGYGGRAAFTAAFLQEYVDSSIRYEKESKSVILSTDSSLLYMQEESTAAALNNEPLQLRLAPEVKDKVTYLPADTLENLYGFEIEEDTNTGAVLLMTAGESVPLGKVKGKEGGKTKALRSEPSVHAPIFADMNPGMSYESGIRTRRTGYSLSLIMVIRVTPRRMILPKTVPEL